MDAEDADFPHTEIEKTDGRGFPMRVKTSSRQPRERSEAHPCPSEYIRVNVRYAPAIRVLRVHPFVEKNAESP